MKIYVDEIPKNCAECEHCTKAHEGKYGIPFCNVARMPIYNGQDIKGRGHHLDSINDFDCPLNSIDDLECQLQTYEKRWEKLERYITDKHNTEEHNAIAMTDILFKMRELEEGRNETI